MDSIFIILDEISHQLNSPLAGAKSYVYLAKRLIEKDNAEKSVEYLELLDKKLDLLAKRVDIILTAMKLETSKVNFAYELFDIGGHEILADRKAISTITESAQQLTGNTVLEISGDKKSIVITCAYKARPTSDDKDIRTDYVEKAIVMHQLVKHHGGNIKDTPKELKITLPTKPR